MPKPAPKGKNRTPSPKRQTASYVLWFVPLATVFVLMIANTLAPTLAVAAITFALIWILMIPAIVCAVVGVPLMLARFAAHKHETDTTGAPHHKRFGLGTIVLLVFVLVIIISAIQLFVALGGSGSGPIDHPEDGGYCLGAC